MDQKRALVIDDNVTNVEVLVSLLEAQGVTSEAIYSPSDLDSVLSESDHFDLIFLDLEMPKLNGYEVFSYLQQRVNPTIPIVAYTVHISEINVARQVGFHSFLGKPLDMDSFPHHLSQILSGEGVWVIP